MSNHPHKRYTVYLRTYASLDSKTMLLSHADMFASSPNGPRGPAPLRSIHIRRVVPRAKRDVQPTKE